MGRSKKGRDSYTATFQDDETRLAKAFNGYSNNDSIVVLNAIEETMQELETKKQALDFVSSEDENEAFQAAGEQLENFETETTADSIPGRHLVTTEEVTNALRRVETGQSVREGPIQVVPEIVKKGLRSRFHRKSKAKRRKDKRDEEKVAGIFGTTTRPPKWSLSHYLQSVASTREKRVVALSAWVLALIGLIISLVLVTKDFINSRKEMASTIRFVESNILELPSIWLCTMDTSLPHFVEQPSGLYRGQPFLWIDFFRGSRANANVTYPNTMELPQLDVITVNILGQRCKAQEVMNPEVYENENKMAPKCFQCFSISRRPAIEFENVHENIEDKHRTTTGDYTKHATFRISRHSFSSKCRTSQFGLSRDIFGFFKSQIKEHHAGLKEEGILDYGIFDAGNDFHDQYLWPLYRMGFANATVDFAVFDVIDMFCNVYMFSGYFYPSSSKAVKFKFNDVYYRWERVGGGPYYPGTFEDFYAGSSSAASLYSLNQQIGAEQYENKSMYAGQAVQILTNHSRIGGAERIAALEPNHMASLRLTRNMIRDRESYQANVFRTTIEPGDIRAVNYVYYLDLSFDTFLTRVVSDQLRVSWPAFIADFFGLTSLFLDVSVYTLIVSPLIMRARKRALLARKMIRRGQNLV